MFLYRYNDCWYVANQATDDIHNRACYETFANVMLVTNAIRNSCSSGPPGEKLFLYFLFLSHQRFFFFLIIFSLSGQLGDNSLGIAVAISSSSTGTPMSKSMITNASFRTKKLPGKCAKYVSHPIKHNRSLSQKKELFFFTLKTKVILFFP